MSIPCWNLCCNLVSALKRQTGLCLVVVVAIAGCAQQQTSAPVTAEPEPPICSMGWYQSVEQALKTSDSEGHGPDLGSSEWMSVVEFKLGVRGRADVPAHHSEAWCRYVDDLISTESATESGPSFSCAGPAAEGSIAASICGDAVLSALDRKLADVYRAALLKAANEHPPVLKAEQRGWLKGRDECWKAADRYRCISIAYQRRIAELQARYQLIGSVGPIAFECDNQAAKEVVVRFYRTDIPTLIAEFGDSVSVMYQVVSTDGIRYEGRNESFHKSAGGITSIVWGYQQPAMNCQQRNTTQ